MYQGYDVSPVIVHHDNKSAIVLGQKGLSTSTRTAIKYFFIKDLIDRKEVTVVHTDTDSMIADYFTKPLQVDSFARCEDLS